MLIGVSAMLLAIGMAVRTGHLNLQPVLSGSMRPTFQPGDLLATWRVPISSLHVGEVIAFVPPGKNYEEMHRIVALKRVGAKTTITTRGDANHGRNDPWGPVALQGKSVYRLAVIIPKLGWASQIPRGIILPVLLIGAGLIFAVSGLTNLRGSRSGTTGSDPTSIHQPQ